MAARFILSFDCEGKWGSADRLTPMDRRILTDQGLRQSYGAILKLLDDYAIEATFAFVGAFSQSRDAFARMERDLQVLHARAPEYLGPALRDIEDTRGDGWHGDALVDAVVGSKSRHEIALHGVTHVPWTSIDSDFAQREMSLFRQLEGPIAASRTFVYPRNMVAHADVLQENGFAGFRAARQKRSRVASFLSELDVFSTPDRIESCSDIIEIPAGFFLNWRSGPRRLVPPAVTQMRAKRLLDQAATNGGVVHYWLHPENIATAPSTLNLLRALLAQVARARDTGRCEVLTQLGYCRLAGTIL